MTKHFSRTYFTLILCGLFSCQIKEDISPLFDQSSKQLVVELPESDQAILKVEKVGCEKNGYPSQWDLFFQSIRGSHTIKLNYDNSLGPGVAAIDIEGLELKASVPLPVSQKTAKQICSALEAGKEKIKIEKQEILANAQTIVGSLAPACQIAFDSDSAIRCSLATRGTPTAVATIEQLQKTLIKRWKRHPYLLARRIAIGRKLGLALNSKEFDRKILQICNIVRQSTKEELPLAMRSKQWFEATCLGKSDRSRELTLLALETSIVENKKLMDALRNNSRLGTFSLRIPSTESPSRDFWVSLRPVYRADGDSIRERVHCWHPLYADPLNLAIHDHLMYEAKDEKAACSARQRLLSEVEYLNLQVSNYVKDSIASETEFAISNGRSKVLRLPVGEYTYTVQSYSGSETFFPRSSSDKSSGTIAWTSRRPRLTIRSW